MSSNTQQARFYPEVDYRAGAAIALLVCCACALGLTIAMEKWLIVASALALLLLLAWPMEAAVGLYALLLPFEPLTGTGGGSGPSDTLLRYVGLVALVVVPLVGWLRHRLVRPPRAALFWVLFVSWAAASTFWAISQDDALARLPTAAGLCLLYLVMVSVQIDQKELSRITLLAILGGSSAALYSSYRFLSSGSMMGRASLTDGPGQVDPNFFAATLMLPVALAIGEVLSARSLWRRCLYLTAVGAMALAVFLTMSRGALAAAATILCVFALRLRLNWRLLFPVAVLGVALLFVPSMFFERVHDVSHDRVSGRWDIWEAGAHSMTKYGLIGAGLANFPNAYQEFAGTARFYSGEKRASHNIYLASSVEMGILGIAAFLAAVVAHLRKFSRPARTVLSPARVIALEAGCWAMLVAGLSLDLLWNKAFWFVWTLPVIAIQVIQKDE